MGRGENLIPRKECAIMKKGERQHGAFRKKRSELRNLKPGEIELKKKGIGSEQWKRRRKTKNCFRASSGVC